MSEELFQPDAELAVLSIILQKPELIYELKELKPFMFSSGPNQNLFAVIQELSFSNLIPEINLIDSYLKSKNKETSVGGRDYLNYLIKQNFNPENMKEFERIVVKAYKARSIISMSTKLPQMLTETRDVDGIISNLRKFLDGLSENSGGESTISLTEALKTSWDSIVERVKNPGIRGVTSGFRDLDESTSGLNAGDLWVIAGRPAMGKSATICNMILNQAKQGIPVLLFSYEMPKVALVERLLALETGISISDIRLGLLNQKAMDLVSETIKQIKDLNIYIDTNFSANLEYIVSTIRRYHRLNGIKVAFIDYVQLMADRNSESTNEIGRICRAMKLLANELGITIVLLSQLNRGVEMREDKRPVLSDMRQSGNLEEDADLVIGLYRDAYYNKNTKTPDSIEFIILKQRNGPTGLVPLKINLSNNRIYSER